MSRNAFYPVATIPVTDLLLDTDNPRIRHGADQADCLARLLRNKDTLLNLLKDIAENGLTPEHILVSKTSDEKWRVRDGNRRVAALKLLSNPALASPDGPLIDAIQRAAETHRANIPDAIDCIACDDEKTILDYLERKHTGENAGVGQKTWDALLISLFKLNKGETDQHKRSAQLLLWAETQGLQIEDSFPITTLSRGLNNDTLTLIGFSVENDVLVPKLSTNQAYALASRVINDMASGRINVSRDGSGGSIYSAEDRIAYFQKVRAEIGPPVIANVQTLRPPIVPPAPQQGTHTPGTPSSPTREAPPTVTPPNNTVNQTPPPRLVSSPASLPQNRKRLFGTTANASPGIAVPSSEAKAQHTLVELRKLNPHDTPLAVTMLLRALIELSTNHYRQKHGLKDEQHLHKSVASAADHMKQNGKLSDEQHNIVMHHTRHEAGMLHIKTIQSYVHKTTFMPNGQTLNTIWDEIGCFVGACWR